MELNPEIRSRIFKAADELYERDGRAAFPNVDTVRKLARVNMNDASSAMKEWRRLQMLPAVAPITSVPDSVRQRHNEALVHLWQESQEQTNEALRQAQAAWDSERAAAETLRIELSAAYEAQGAELASLQNARSEDRTRFEQELAAQRAQLATATAQLAALQAREQELQQTLQRHEQDAREARVAAQQASERAAKLEGQVEAYQQQTNEISGAIKALGRAQKPEGRGR